MQNQIKQVGNLWNDKTIEIYEVNGKKYALNNFNGEAYTDVWEVADDDGLNQVNSAKKYIARPTFEKDSNGDFYITDLEIESI